MVLITYCYKIPEERIKELKKFLKNSPSLFNPKFRDNPEEYEKYISQEFVGSSYECVEEEKLKDYIENLIIPKNTRERIFTRIIIVDLFGNIKSTIKNL